MASDGVCPPLALAAFLGEEPSEAALRRPGTGSHVQVSTPSSALREDSSPDVADVPLYDGGFDDFHNDMTAPVPEAEPIEPGRTRRSSPRANSEHRPPQQQRQQQRQHLQQRQQQQQQPNRALPPRRPSEGRTQSGGSDVSKGVLASSRVSHTSCLSETSTPGPSALSNFLGDAPAAAALRRSLSGGTQRSPSNSSRPHSGSRQRREKSAQAHGPVGAVLHVDPLGMSRRRFGGRG
mmetsp:Transcript_30023/g.80132  ORF Transcript_30023/g.80132 Transcript_30023/m.80132 type:complete len:236 (-) Transcript_30023:65-772(-)